MTRYMVSGVVFGTVHFPDRPDHEGRGGIIGGEDVYAARVSFRSPGEAMTWCRRVLDGTVKPRVGCDGELLSPHSEPCWTDARVTVRDGDGEAVWATDEVRRTWHVFDDGETRYGAVVRTDWAKENAA